MKAEARWLAVLLIGAGTAWAQRPPADWSAESRQLAAQLVEQYGAPAQRSDYAWTWRDRGVFKKTVLLSTGPRQQAPAPHREILEQSIEYNVPPGSLAAVKRFEGCLSVDDAAGLLVARCGGPAMNYLVLNLANEVATGKRSVGSARAFYRRNAVDYANRKASMYTEGLLFEPHKGLSRGEQPAS